jgi:hypothetical protein
LSYNERPFHLAELAMYKHKPGGYAEPSVTVPICVTQSALDGLNTLIRLLEGYQLAKSGQIPGHFELIMFYRTLTGSIHAANQHFVEANSPREFPEAPPGP